jgi:poly-gamma-glutamate capsule biosynthesis protein CapA/YwtB (metallophosphatase superfamily)
MRNALKAVGAIIAVIALCAPLMFLPEEDTQPVTPGYATVTITVPPTVVVATTIPGLETTTTTTTVPTDVPPVTTTTSSTTTTTGPIDVTIAAVGGVFTSPEILDSVKNTETGSYDFSPIFIPIAPYLSNADYAVANLQPRLAGPEVGYDSESTPNAPRELAFALNKAGIDLVGTANAHSLDLGWEGVIGTLDRLDDAGLAHVGTYRTSAERNTPLIVDVKGVKVAFLNYAATVDGALPGDQPSDFAVGRLDLETVTLEANTARSWGADVVVAMIDYGVEFEAEPSAEQKTLAEDILSHGVDVILGSRAGVIQTIGHFYPFVRATHCYVAYSLGDFLAVPEARPVSAGVPQAGVAVYVHLRKLGLRTYVTGIDFMPLYVQTGTVDAGGAGAGETTTTGAAAGRSTVFRILPVLPGLEPDTDVLLTAEDRTAMNAIWEYARNKLYRPDEDIVPLVPSQLGL